MSIISDCVIYECHLHRRYKVNPLAKGVFCYLFEACRCLRRRVEGAKVFLRSDCADMNGKIKRNLLFYIKLTVISEPGIDTCFRACLCEDDIIGMCISIEQIYRICVRVAADIITNRTEGLFIKSISNPYGAKRLGVLRRIEAVKVVVFIIKMRSSRIKSSQKGHRFVGRTGYVTRINWAL